jgi:AcrR family transcriptional regulator
VATVNDKRPYSSAVRDEQAARTRERILDAAAELFLDQGYARTTVQHLAERAGVARDTVHAAFGSKARVLTALIDTRLVPDGGVANITETPAAQAIKAELDPQRQIELFATWICGVSTRLRPVFEILRTASAVEPEMAAVFAQMDRYRLENMRTYARWFAARGPLRVPTKRAGEVIWALASPDVARMLCDGLGWSEAEHARWLADALTRGLLPDRAAE